MIPRTCRLVLLALLAWTAGASFAVAQADAPRRAQRSEREIGAARSERLRARWRELPASERERLERRLGELERLTPAERRALLERARALREHERELSSEPTPAAARPASAGPGDGPVSQEKLRAHIKERGRALREELPPEVLVRFERARASERAPLLASLRARWNDLGAEEREELGRAALLRLRGHVEVPPSALEHLERLPVEERLRRFVLLRRAAERGRPGEPGVPRRPR